MASVESRQVVSLLIALWDGMLSRGELIRKTKKKNETSKEYHIIIDSLNQDGRIEILQEKKPNIKLSKSGRQLLKEYLKHPDFQFTTQISKRTANVLLAIMRSQDLDLVENLSVNTESVAQINYIDSYEVFKKFALETYDRLNQEFNLDDLVPIYRIRRVLGEKVSRKNFDTWLLEMQSNDIFQLLEGSVEDSALEKIEDSIMTKVSGLRCYVKRLNV